MRTFRCSNQLLGSIFFAGAIPIPGAKRVEQARDHVAALQWELEDNEVQIINEKLTNIGL